MAQILSLERHYSHQAVAAFGWTPHTADSRHSGFLELIPDHPGTKIGEESIVLMGRLALRTTQENWLVAVVDPFNPHDPIPSIAVLVVTHPFAVRTLFGKFVCGDESFQRNLRMGWNRQARQLALDYFNRTAAHASRPVQLALAIARPLGAGCQEQQRVG